MTIPEHGCVLADASRLSAILHRGSAQCGLELFAAYGIALHPVLADIEDPAFGDIAFISVAGFSSPYFNGFVVLGTSERMLGRSNLTASSSSDWMGELGNQFLGRIKNRLLKEGISIARVPPAVVTGGAPVRFYSRTRETPVMLTDDKDTVVIWTESEPSLGASSVRLGPVTDVLAEGEMILF